MTKSGAVPNAPCIFPWKYGDDDTEYDGCANPSLSSVGDWCPTELDNEGKYISGSGKWGACAESCPKSKNKPNGIDCESNEQWIRFFMKRPAAPPAFCPRFLLPEPNKSKHNTEFHEKSEALPMTHARLTYARWLQTKLNLHQRAYDCEKEASFYNVC